MHKFLKLKEVISIIGLSRATIYRDVAAGTFPKPMRTGKRSVAWLDDDIAAWQDKIIAAHKGNGDSK